MRTAATCRRLYGSVNQTTNSKQILLLLGFFYSNCGALQEATTRTGRKEKDKWKKQSSKKKRRRTEDEVEKGKGRLVKGH